MYGDFKNVSRRFRAARIGGLIAGCLIALSAAAAATRAVEPELATLPGHVHKLAAPRFDAGEASSSLRMSGLEFVFAKTPAQELALSDLIAGQQDPKSPLYHHWLTPAQYGARFGASDAVIAALSKWLKSNGLEPGAIPAGRGHLPFSGTKAQVEAALHTNIHLFNVNGEQHFANVSDPMIPASLKSAVAAIRGLNDFYPKPGVKPLTTVPRFVLPTLAVNAARVPLAPDTFYSGTGQYPGYVGPTDFATIYNLLPLYQQGITGAGVTIAIAAQSDIDPAVLTTFWGAFGVAGSNFGLPAQQFTSIPVPGGTDPGRLTTADGDEAYLDTEILGALAPGATLILVRDASALNAAQYVIDQNLAAILNVSFGQCEGVEAANNATTNSMWQQAVTEGITVTVSSADAGTAACTAQADLGTTNDVNSNGFAVNGLASTPYDLAVGGTDFNPTLESSYWGGSNQSGTLATAMSHIPEMVWNDSCANPVIAQAFGVSDPIAFCNDANLPGVTPATVNSFIDISGDGGGLSSCITADNNGNCTGGYPQPSWQQGVLGLGSLGTRAIPDVAMIATRWLICSYDTTPCDPTKAPTFAPAATGTIKVLDGTSAAAPAVAAILALLDQTQITTTLTDGRQGLVNPMLYRLAATEYASAATVTACDANQGAITSSACVFYDVTVGSNAQPCSVASYTMNAAGTLPASTCGHESGDATGIMEISGTQDYVAGSGFDIASGLGSINAAALIASLRPPPAPPTALKVAAAGAGSLGLSWTASTGAVTYNIFEGTKTGAESATPSVTGVTSTSTTISGLTPGQQYFFTVVALDASGASAPSTEASGTVIPAVPTGLSATAGNATASLTWTAAAGATSYNVYEGTTSGAEGVQPIQTGLTSASASITGLSNGTTYYFTVVAVDAGGASGASNQASAKPTAPTSGGGGGSMDWFALGLLALLAAGRAPTPRGRGCVRAAPAEVQR